MSKKNDDNMDDKVTLLAFIISVIVVVVSYILKNCDGS